MHSSKVTPMLGDPETKYRTDPDGDSVTEIALDSPDKHHLGGAARMPQATRRLSKRWSSMPPDEQERIQEQANRFGGVNEETQESFKSLLKTKKYESGGNDQFNIFVDFVYRPSPRPEKYKLFQKSELDIS